MTKWTLIDWDGNPALGYKCWRKAFNHGHVSVGVGQFLQVIFSFGRNSDNSFSSTHNGKHLLTEAQAMAMVDKHQGQSLY